MRYSGFDKSAVRLLSKVYRSLGTDGNKFAAWLEQGRYDLIINAERPNPHDEDFPRRYAVWNLLRKSSTPDVGHDTEAQALQAWRECESECLRTNRSKGVRPDAICPSALPVAEAVFHTAIRKIADCLGPFDIEQLFRHAEFSGGASTQRRRLHSSIQNKYVDNPYITPAAAKYWYFLHRLTPMDLGTPIFSNYSRLTTVPKDAKTDRPIIIEPQGNMFFQKGLGSMIRMRLKRKGINLNDQTRNQDLAGLGVENRLATIDLSSASDLISYQTVCALFQGAPDWLDVLCDLRVDTTRLNKTELIQLEKFSGMGNGFTFELESLIFWALAEASAEVESLQGGCTCEKVISIYGDDIIVNSHHVDTLVTALSYCGFKVNTSKSYWAGPFRESCGKHYYNGVDISPITVKDQTFTKTNDLYWLYNSVSEMFERLGIPTRDTLAPIEALLRKSKAWNYVPPRFANNSGIRAPFCVAVPHAVRRPKSRKTPWVQGFRVRSYVEKAKSKRVSSLGAYWFKLRSMEHSVDSEVTLPRCFAGMPLLNHFRLSIKTPLELTVVQQATGSFTFVDSEVSVWD